MASLRKFSAVLLGLMALNACTFWTRDFERIVDQSGRDFTIDPDKHYKQVDLFDLAAHPSSYKLMDVRFQAIINRHDEQIFIALYTTFRQEDYAAFSAWPAEARLWEASERVRSIPTLYMRKDNLNFQNLIDARRFALVEIRARVMGDYDQRPWLEVFYVDEVIPAVYTEQSLVDYREGMEAYAKNMPAPAVAKLEAAVKAPLHPKVRVQVRFVLAKIYEGRSDWSNAAVHYDAILSDDENNQAAWEGWERCMKQLDAQRGQAPQPRKKR